MIDDAMPRCRCGCHVAIRHYFRAGRHTLRLLYFSLLRFDGADAATLCHALLFTNACITITIRMSSPHAAFLSFSHVVFFITIFR